MNKATLIIVGIILLAISASVLYLLNTNEPAPTQQQTTTNRQSIESTGEKTEDNPVAPTAETPGAYVDYTSDVIAKTPGTKILFFHAPWCPQCRAIEADITNSSLPSDVTIIKVDYDSNQDLRQKYGVTIQTTLVRIDDQGNLVEKFVAYDDPTLDSVIRNLL
jgi:thiol-disulfide isomerase/thioredoxin